MSPVAHDGGRKGQEESLAQENDGWEEDGILEYYWGEHIHLGYYNEDELKRGYKNKDFVKAKYDLVDEMMKFGGIGPDEYAQATVLDVGCGIGGTSRYLAKQLGPKSTIIGVNLSPGQVKRATELAQGQGVSNAEFQVANALDLQFEDNSFDVVWACESGEQMPDKEKYINEMIRVLKPGGKLIISTWCQRDDSNVPFTKKDMRHLQYFGRKWNLPPFISVQAYDKLLQKTGLVEKVRAENWSKYTIASWRHSIWVGLYDPRGWIGKPKVYVKSFRDAFGLERMHGAHKRGLMEYGVIAATKLTLCVEEKKDIS